MALRTILDFARKDICIARNDQKGQRAGPSEWRYCKRTGLFCIPHLFSATRVRFVGQMAKKSICIAPVSEWLEELVPDEGARGEILGETPAATYRLSCLKTCIPAEMIK